MILIYSDPHLGLNLAANTTPASRAALQLKLETHLESILRDKQLRGELGGPVAVCGGDFFHSYSNSETVVLRALSLANRTSLILSGNHDVVGIADRNGSLDLLREFSEAQVHDQPFRVIPTVFDQIHYSIEDMSYLGWELVMVPHHTTQGQFEEALLQAAKKPKGDGLKRALITHCNYDLNFAVNDNTLNLSRPMADHLLNKGAYFDYIFLGHEHNPRQDFDGRLVVIGNPHPTGFGDISDKQVVLLHHDGSVSYRQVWSKAEGYFECGPDDLHEVPPGIQFLRVKGEVEPPALHTYAKAIRKLWQSSPNLFAVRSEVAVKAGNKQTSLGKSEVVNVKDLITEELRGNEALFALWQEISA